MSERSLSFYQPGSELPPPPPTAYWTPQAVRQPAVVQPWQEDPYVLGGRERSFTAPEWPRTENGMLPRPVPGMRWETPKEYQARLLRAMMNPNYGATHPGVGNHIDAVQVPTGFESPWLPKRPQ